MSDDGDKMSADGSPLFGSLFSGVGGMDLGLERAGWRCAFQVEIDDYCRRVLTKHWPLVPKYRDIKDFDGTGVERVDMLAGGFPCQPVSLAGKRSGQEDERWLWPEFARLIRVLRPRYVLVENVPGILVRGWGDVLGDLSAIGYDAEWSIVSACSMGAPHMRRRVFGVAYTQGEGRRGRRILHSAEMYVERDRLRSGTGGQWPDEPSGPRVAYGVPRRVDRLRGTGNAVVPACAEYVGRLILHHWKGGNE